MSEVEKPKVFHEFVERYGPLAGEEGPVLFVQEVLGINPDPWQERILRDFGRGERHIAVKSCHGPGKTALASWLVLLMLLTRLPQKTVATAPTSGQLHGALVPEIKMWFSRLPQPLQQLYDVKQAGIYLTAARAESYFEARTSRAESPEALQGIHSQNVLLIADEASGVPEAIFEAAVGSMSGHNATTLLIGNPVRTTGLFFNIFSGDAGGGWKKYTVSHKDSPRVTDDFVQHVARTYGAESNEFRVRALGEFPLADEDTVIPHSLVAAAQGRDIQEAVGVRKVWGLDVARFGGDKCSLSERTPRTGKVLEVWGKSDIMATVGRVKSRWDDLQAHDRPYVILVDVIGLGAGAVDRLREMGLPARGINVAETASISEKYNRARSELWWRCREWLQTNEVRLEPPENTDAFGEDLTRDPQLLLAEELKLPRYKYTSTGKIDVEPKASMRKRARKSPDVADSFVLTFAEDLTRAVHGSAGSGRWGEPIKRNLAVV